VINPKPKDKGRRVRCGNRFGKLASWEMIGFGYCQVVWKDRERSETWPLSRLEWDNSREKMQRGLKEWRMGKRWHRTCGKCGKHFQHYRKLARLCGRCDPSDLGGLGEGQ
jgi:transposase InsO family protein